MSDLESTPQAWYLGAAPATVSRWMQQLQWTRVAVDALVLLAALGLSTSDFPLRRLAPLLAAEAALRADLAWRLRNGRLTRRWEAGLVLGIDALILTGVLELTGGPSNPFAVIYAVLIALAGATLGTAWAVGMGTFAAVAYAVLIAWHLEELVPAHHRLIDFPTHLFTMWLALALLAELIAHFMRQASAAIAEREQQLADMRQQRARAERLMSLTTLAAGAAHELSTPLGTIAVASRELERALTAAAANASWQEDARLIREQVERCHTILDQMSGRAGGSAAHEPESIDVAELFDDLRSKLSREQAGRLELNVLSSSPRVVAPRTGLAQVLLSLVKNAFEASSESQPVTLEALGDDRRVRFIVRDEGHGMPAEILSRAGEPFFTTKEPGRGFGLGLFLARMFAERCGGTLTIESARGTVAILELPVPRQAVVAQPGEPATRAADRAADAFADRPSEVEPAPRYAR